MVEDIESKIAEAQAQIKEFDLHMIDRFSSMGYPPQTIKAALLNMPVRKKMIESLKILYLTSPPKLTSHNLG